MGWWDTLEGRICTFLIALIFIACVGLCCAWVLNHWRKSPRLQSLDQVNILYRIRKTTKAKPEPEPVTGTARFSQQHVPLRESPMEEDREEESEDEDENAEADAQLRYNNNRHFNVHQNHQLGRQHYDYHPHSMSSTHAASVFPAGTVQA
eukprot:TRINITY_DN99355_c0_g1_i1.p1 TRINITY_DN99355_c0_g1~~TRINITY_DN99355_c0_g1_i1.p1  ORF type:complete len:150 (+),score=14.71 TRINITY_DN99355_c0_g1_i1:66-515(+)